MTQNDTVVARASALFLRRGEQPADPVWTSPIEMPPPPTEPADVPGDFTMELVGLRLGTPALTRSQHGSLRMATRRPEVRLGACREAAGRGSEPVTPFIRAAMAGDVTSSANPFPAQAV